MPTLTAVRVIPWARANLNYTAQALITSAAVIKNSSTKSLRIALCTQHHYEPFKNLSATWTSVTGITSCMVPLYIHSLMHQLALYGKFNVLFFVVNNINCRLLHHR